MTHTLSPAKVNIIRLTGSIVHHVMYVHVYYVQCYYLLVRQCITHVLGV